MVSASRARINGIIPWAPSKNGVSKVSAFSSAIIPFPVSPRHVPGHKFSPRDPIPLRKDWEQRLCTIWRLR